jgi:uncharacterized coiled-coil protein SlyX
MDKYLTTHLPPEQIDALRFEAFRTNKKSDIDAYYKAASLYFQERLEREMNRANRIEKLEANIDIKADFIDATLNQLAASEQRIEELEAKLAALTSAAIKVHDSYWNSTDGVITGMYDLEWALRLAELKMEDRG